MKKKEQHLLSKLWQKCLMLLVYLLIFLMSGSSDDLADSSLTDKELLNQFKAIEKMQENDKSVVKTFLMLS